MKEQLIVTLNVGDLQNIIDECIVSAIVKNQPPKENPEEILLRRKDVAKLFGISLVTVDEWMRLGKIPYYRVNSRIFFKKKEVLDCLDSIKKYGRNKSQNF